MKAKIGFLVLVVFLLSVVNVRAQWNALSSGYAITTNWHGEEVPIGENVTAWAGTKNPEVEEVKFQWKDPDENVVWDPEVTITGPYTTPNVPDGVPQEIKNWAKDNPNIDIWYANNTQTPNIIGHWTVKAFFIGEDGKTKCGVDDTIMIRATSFEVIPELPVVGTAGAMVTMLLSLVLFYKKTLP